ncbi:Phenylacetic acid catabolic protein [Kitasatospora sp. NPDC089509]|uniref:Phenylacetic acid catabolic protein n=1 Tax=Kitasatospora sp. NPDC089509 TaxID=3364079 RepID=UPI0037F306B1
MPAPITDQGAPRRSYELNDPMPSEVRAGARRFASVQALNELVGVLPFAAWLNRAPSLSRKQMLMAKIQDEVGHGHVAARVAQDLGAGWESILRDYVEGRAKVHNIFHYDFESWEEFGPGLLLMNSAAIVQFQSLGRGVYLPYARALRKIEREESFHYQHALDMTHEVLHSGDTAQRRRAQDAFEVWMRRVLAYFGPPDTDTLATNPMHVAGLKPHGNDELRQQWLGRIVPVCRGLGMHVDPDLVREASPGHWEFDMPDWTDVKRVIAGGGPASEQRLAWIRGVLERNAADRISRVVAA